MTEKNVDVSIPIGPLHPALKEPLRIKLHTEGERVVDAEVELGYMHRGIERILKGKPWNKAVYLAERVCGICSNIHCMTFIETLEKISDVEPTPRAKYLRVIVNELDRIQSHLIANVSYFLGIEHETLAMYMLDVRENSMDALEIVSGNRVHMTWNVLGGVRWDVEDHQLKMILETLDKMEPRVRRYRGMFAHGPLLQLRSKGIGVLSYEDATKVPAVGPVARGSGHPESDWRLRHPTYRDIFDFKAISRKEGDNTARVLIRFDEIFQSMDLIRDAIDNLPEGDIKNRGKVKAGEGFHSGEAPRGELKYFVKTDSAGKIDDITIRTPTRLNLESCVGYMLAGSPSIADAVAIYASIDPCIACTEG